MPEAKLGIIYKNMEDRKSELYNDHVTDEAQKDALVGERCE